MQIPADYIERVYAGWYGKIIGIRHGSNIEGWSYEKIAETYGEIRDYLFRFKNFAADDDSNGPIFFIRALEDSTCTEEITPKEMGEGVLNYVPWEHGFFWWGGYGNSTENTAYLNLAHGIEAPLSGSAELNGEAVAEQIGGQIFIDTWGLVNPCDYRRAARYAAKMASVTHGGNGIYGGMFIAACVSAAFASRDVHKVIQAGLSVIPEDCQYRRMAGDVLRFHQDHPENWRDCFAFIKANYGYDRYPGACHIIPNAAVVLLSLLYGGGDFSRSINICNMCGWDTDCNVANVGCILGVMVGLEGIGKSWREPIGDLLVCSSVLGCMNLRDIANDAFYLASLGYRVAGEPYPEACRELLEGTAPRFSFALPESTHTFRALGGELRLFQYCLRERLWGPLPESRGGGRVLAGRGVPPDLLPPGGFQRRPVHPLLHAGGISRPDGGASGQGRPAGFPAPLCPRCLRRAESLRGGGASGGLDPAAAGAAPFGRVYPAGGGGGPRRGAGHRLYRLSHL